MLRINEEPRSPCTFREKINVLSKELTEQFPIDYSKSCFNLYPFSNESKYSEVLDLLKSAEPIHQNGKIRVAIVFGESNILSILPELALHADLILLADIEPKLHKHTQHMQDCFSKSTTPDEFIKNYSINNPIEHEIYDESELTTQTLEKELKSQNYSLRAYHFISSQQRFNECKNAVSRLAFTHINFNLLDSNMCPDNHCRKLPSILKKHDAILTFSNFTNIHMYCSGRKKELESNAGYLFQDVKDYFVMFSDSDLITHASNSLTDYNKFVNNRFLKYSPGLFSNRNNNTNLDVRNNSRQFDYHL